MLFKHWLILVKAMLSYFLFSVKYKKTRCAMRFFDLNFLNVQGILAQKIYNAHIIFQPSALDQLVTGEPQPTRISCPKESWSCILINKFI